MVQVVHIRDRSRRYYPTSSVVTESICWPCVSHCFRSYLITAVFAVCAKAAKSKSDRMLALRSTWNARTRPGMPMSAVEKECRNALSNLELCNGRSLHVARGSLIDSAQRNCSFEQVHWPTRARARSPAIPYVRAASVSLWKVSPGTQSALSIITASLIALLVDAW